MKKNMFSNFPLLTSGIKGWKLAKFAFSDERKKYRIKQQYKSFFLAMFNPFFAKKWFNKINSSEFSEILFFRPRLFLKPFKAYMSITWTKEEKMKVIIDTYTFLLSKKGKRNLISQEIVISKFLLKDGTEARVIIGYDDRYRKEGEIVMSLFCGELHGVISSIAFSFEEQSPDHWVCWIGCLQGRPQTEGTYVTKKAQKLMYGIRPKALLFELLQKLINDLDIKEIYGIGDGIQAQKRKHFIHLPRLHTIAFSYDGFWNELGGDYQEDGWYRLPVKTVRKDINNIKSHKRAYYKKRYELVNLILLDIEEFLSR